MENKDIFIKLLEFGEKAGINGTDTDSLRKHFEDAGIIRKSSGDPHEWLLLHKLLIETFTHESIINKWVLKAEYYSRLLEYRELQETIKNAKSATRISCIAITISLIALLASIFIGYKQIVNTVTINQEQINDLKNYIKQK